MIIIKLILELLLVDMLMVISKYSFRLISMLIKILRIYLDFGLILIIATRLMVQV